MNGKIERVPLREIWKREEDFTKWLQDNIDVLNDVVDLSLSSAEREHPAGDFNVDVVAEDDPGNLVMGGKGDILLFHSSAATEFQAYLESKH